MRAASNGRAMTDTNVGGQALMAIKDFDIASLGVGDRVMIDSYEGFGGPATIITERDSPTGRFQVRMDDDNPPPFWAHDFEVSPHPDAPPKPFSSRPATRQHIALVRSLLEKVIDDLVRRQREHDQSKLVSPEVEVFDEMTPKLAACTYGSDEYKGFLAAMKPALDHHYAANPGHHPEGNPEGIKGMSLVDILEMLIDWKAATTRHNDGCIRLSIEINQKRFGYGDELKRIFLNTLPLIESP